MPWNKNDYPPSFKNLSPDVKEKAIEIANALVRDDYEEDRAISIALSKARESVEGESNEERSTYYVKKREQDWSFFKNDQNNPIFIDDKKAELLEKAKPYVNEHNGILKIYEEDGTLEDTLYE